MRMLRSLLGGLTAALLAIAVWPLLAEAVIIAPHAVFISSRTRTGEIILQNNTSDAEEITVDLVYGYPTGDSTGRVYVTLIEHPDSSMRSAASWIRAFPRQVRLAPNQRQVVRLLATPPAGLAPGEYWSRVIVTSRGTTTPVAGSDSLVQAGLTLVTRTIISVTYRNGTPTTGVRLDDFHVDPPGDTLRAWTTMVREGNGAYLGTVVFGIVDANGHTVREQRTQIAVYHTLQRKFDFDISDLAPGHYTLRMDLTTARDDLPQANILPGNELHQSATFDIS